MRTPAYGYLKLRPWEFDRLSIFEFWDMLNGYYEALTESRWEKAYWTVNIISPYLKSPVKAETLMKPFLKPKTKATVAREAQEFFADFARQRKEIENGR